MIFAEDVTEKELDKIEEYFEGIVPCKRVKDFFLTLKQAKMESAREYGYSNKITFIDFEDIPTEVVDVSYSIDSHEFDSRPYLMGFVMWVRALRHMDDGRRRKLRCKITDEIENVPTSVLYEIYSILKRSTIVDRLNES